MSRQVSQLQIWEGKPGAWFHGEKTQMISYNGTVCSPHKGLGIMFPTYNCFSSVCMWVCVCWYVRMYLCVHCIYVCVYLWGEVHFNLWAPAGCCDLLPQFQSFLQILGMLLWLQSIKCLSKVGFWWCWSTGSILLGSLRKINEGPSSSASGLSTWLHSF